MHPVEIARAEIEQQLVLLPSELAADSLLFTENLLTQPNVIFTPTTVRGSTITSLQGDHATAYSLYWEVMRVATATSSIEEAPHVSAFIEDILSKLPKEMIALESCGLYTSEKELMEKLKQTTDAIIKATKIKPIVWSSSQEEKMDQMLIFCKKSLPSIRVNKEVLTLQLGQLILAIKLFEHLKNWQDKFDSLKRRVMVLQTRYNDEIRDLKKQYKAHKDLMKTANALRSKLMTQASQAFLKEITPLLDHIDSLKQFQNLIRSQIKTLKIRYFSSIIRELAEQYLLFQNQMPYVTFQKISTMEADKGEGARISKALKKLRSYDVQKITSIEIKDIVKNIEILLFLPKIENAALLDSLKKEKMEKLANITSRVNILQYLLIRDNDLNVFSYIVAKHLQTVFNAFPKLIENDDVKKTIIQKFMQKVFASWNLSKAEQNECTKRIDKLLIIYLAPIETLIVSVAESPTHSLTSSLGDSKPSDQYSETSDAARQQAIAAPMVRTATAVTSGPTMLFAAPDILRGTPKPKNIHVVAPKVQKLSAAKKRVAETEHYLTRTRKKRFIGST